MMIGPDIGKRGEGMVRTIVVRWLATVAAFTSVGVYADDALVETGRAEALALSSHLVVAHNTGKRGSVRERQEEGYWCSFGYEEWVLDSLVRGAPLWKPGARIRVFDAGQEQDCWRGNEYKTTGLDIGLMLHVYASATKLANGYVPGARGVLLGRRRGTRDLAFVVAGSIESPDQADSLGREWDDLHKDAPPEP